MVVEAEEKFRKNISISSPSMAAVWLLIESLNRDGARA